MFKLYSKQRLLKQAIADVDVIIYGGARGGGKSFSSVFFCALDTPEHMTEAEAIEKGIDIRNGYRQTTGKDGVKYYYKFLIDYPYYQGCLVRRGQPELLSNTLVECKKIYPYYGGIFIRNEMVWKFPSGATIILRQAKAVEDADWFQGQNLHRLHIEELTQFEEELVGMMESGVRAPVGQPIRAKFVYTCNPGGRGHAWVYRKYIKPCPAEPDGEKKYVSEVDRWYQPLKPGIDKVIKFGKVFRTIRNIPALVWDNPSLTEGDLTYVINLLDKPEVIQRMWLDGDWTVKAGDFFNLWDDRVHVIDVYDFFKAKTAQELNQKRRNFDWGDYTLIMSYDYGFRAPGGWACGFYAINRYNEEMYKIEDWLMSDLSSTEQARFIKKEMRERYNLDITNEGNMIDYHIGDPNSFWERREDDITWYTFADRYADEGILLVKGINDRKLGAKYMWELHYWDKEKQPLPRLRFLSTAENSVNIFPFLPRDSRDPEDVDTKTNDHNYDENRYMACLWLSSTIGVNNETSRDKSGMTNWRSRLNQKDDEKSAISWKIA